MYLVVVSTMLMLPLPCPVEASEDRKVEPPRSYVAYRASSPLKIDGRLDDAAWKSAPWTKDFVDIEGDKKPKPRFKTRAKMLWDDKNFYICAILEEPHIWGTLTKHDSVIFHDNDFEVFIDPDSDTLKYGELEVNALNTTWDLFLDRPYRDNGQADNSWEIEGLKTAIFVDGTLNDPSDVDTAWSVEIAIPWGALKRLVNRTPPREDDQWRVNFSRVQWRHKAIRDQYVKVPESREDNWVWSPIGIVSMHEPELWGVVQFSSLENPE